MIKLRLRGKSLSRVTAGAGSFIKLFMEHIFVFVLVTVLTEVSLGVWKFKFVSLLRGLGHKVFAVQGMALITLVFDLLMLSRKFKTRGSMVEGFTLAEFSWCVTGDARFVVKFRSELLFMWVGVAIFAIASVAATELKLVSLLRRFCG